MWRLCFRLLVMAISQHMFDAEARRRVSADLSRDVRRPPGTLLLNMLIKDEAEHLQRTLPKWAKIIDYWIIGVDDHNTDDSPEIIQRILGHIPGEIVIVNFDGMGPTWSELVQVGIEKYPEATHGLIADADFAPMSDQLDKMELDLRCSKHMFTIWTQDHRNERRMDWVYRNIPGAAVRRRTHQVVEVPKLLDQEVFQTLLPLNIDERDMGYQDRSGQKNERYIGFLEDDLIDYPNDTRTLYYLGYAHFSIFNDNSQNPSESHWQDLEKGVNYFKQRIELDGNKEELWFTLMKLGEIYERFYHDWDESLKFYVLCTEKDGERADAWFYIGQHYRLRGDDRGLPYLKKAATLEVPDRALFQWHHLYQCLAALDYGRALQAANDPPLGVAYREAITLLTNTQCNGAERAEVESLIKSFQVKVQGGNKSRTKVLKDLLKFLKSNLDYLGVSLSEKIDSDMGSITYYKILLDHMEKIRAYRKQIKKDNSLDTCRRYRQVTTPYLRFVEERRGMLKNLLSDHAVASRWDYLNAFVHSTCR